MWSPFYRKKPPLFTSFISFGSTVIDTPANREGMPDADFKEWLCPDALSNMVHSWVTGEIPDTGSFVSLSNSHGVVVPEFH